MELRVIPAHKFTDKELQNIDEDIEYIFLKLKEYIETVGRKYKGVMPLQLDNSIYQGVSLEKHNLNIWVTIVEDILEVDAFRNLLMMRLSLKGKRVLKAYKDKGWHKSFREPIITQQMAQTLKAKFSRMD